MRIMFWSHWDPNSNGTDYWEPLGIYPGYSVSDKVKAEANQDAWEYASDRFNWPYVAEDDEDSLDPEGPDCYTEVYDPKKHDSLRAGGGSFEDDFVKLEREFYG